MSQINPEDVQHTINDTRTFAFVDVLGYGSVVSGTLFTDVERIRHIVALWESLHTSVVTAKQLYPYVDTVLFSDSLYIAHVDPLVVAGFVGSLYADVATYYSGSPSEWMPWLRAGIAMGWAIDVRDPTVPFSAPDPTACYRNPVGPGPTRAYYLAEKTGLKGARILVDEQTCINVDGSIRGVTSTNSGLEVQHAATILRDRWPQAGAVSIDGAPCPLYDLPWWRFLTGAHHEALRIYQSHAWQIASNDPGAIAHRDATAQMLTKGG